jgi:hypothetical protein
MPINSESLNRKLYDLLTVRGYNPKPLDVEGKVTPVPEESAVMKFDFVKDDKNYGQVWISIDGSKTLQVYYGDAVADSPSDKTRDASYDDTWTGLIRHLKNWAQRRQLGFELKNENHLESDMAKRSHTAKKEKISEASTAGKSNSSFIITAKTAEGDTKKYRVKAQSPNMAKEKFTQHHSMAKILNVSEEGVAEGSEKTASQMSFDNSSEDWKIGYKDYPNYKLHSSLEKTARGKKYRQGWEEAFRASKRIESLKKQDMAEGQTGVSVKKWAAQVRQEHGADTKFSNDKVHDRVIARKDKEIIGSYDRKANNGTVFSPDSIKEGTDDSTQVLSDIVANEDFDALYDLMSSDTEAGKIVQRMYNDVSGEEGLHPDDDFEKILSIVLDHLTQDYGQQGVAEGSADKTVRVVKRNGKPIGEIGIDPEASPGNGSYYVKLYDGSVDESGFDTAEEALAELKYLVKQNVAEGLLAQSDEFKVELDDDGMVHVLDGEGTIRVSMPVNIWKRMAGKKGQVDEFSIEVSDGQVHVLDGEGTIRVSMPVNIWKQLGKQDAAHERKRSLQATRDFNRSRSSGMMEQDMAEGYSLKKTSVSKHMEPGDPEEYTQDVNIKDTDYEIINNKTGQVVGTASQTTNDFMGSGALKITMKNGATRWLDIWDSEKGNPQTAFNRFVKDPKTASKYKGQDMKGVTEMDKTQTSPGRDGDIDWTKKQIHLGPEHTMKAKDVAKHALKVLNKTMKKSQVDILKKKGVAEAKGDEYYDLTAEHVPTKAIPLIKKELAQAGITLKWVKPRKYFEYETIFEIVTNEKGLKVAKNIIWKYNKGNYVGIMNEQDMAEGQESMKQVSEGYYPMGKQGSYSDAVPTTKIVIQHSRRIEEGEQRYRNIAKIFVENSDGERFAVPTIKPGIARVYARHIAEGGTPYDERGKHITSLVEEYSKMAGFVRATKGKQFNESAQQLVNEGLTHYQSLRESLRKMTGHRGYNAYFESWTPSLMEDGEEQTNLNELFVQETLDPRIESVMPILSRLHKKVSEMAETGQLAEWADSLLDETLNVQEENVPLRDKEDLQARRKAIQDIISDPDTAKDPLLKREVMKRKHDLEKEAEAKRLAEEMVDESANVPMDVRTLYAQTYAKFAKTAGAAKGAKQMAYAMVEKKYGKEIADKLKAYHNSNLDEELGEDLDSNQKRVGQLGPTEKVGPQGAVGKLVGANESVVQGVAEGLNEINSNGQEDLDAILRIIKK